MDLFKATTKSLPAGLLLLVFAAAPLAAETPAPPRACDALQQWVVDHRAELPTDYAGLLAYSSDERRAIFGNLSAEQKALVWQERLEAYRAQNPSLGADQQQAFATVLELLEPAFFEKTFKSEAVLAQRNKELDALARKLIRLAGDKVAREAFFDLGSAGAGRGVAQGEIAFNDLCECRQYWDCPPTATTCGSILGEPPCSPISGCGIFFNQDCTGMCIVFDP